MSATADRSLRPAPTAAAISGWATKDWLVDLVFATALVAIALVGFRTGFLGWQWVAGSGADAAPYFRVFNPELQAAKFDPNGIYRERWLGTELRAEPIINLAESRDAALAAYRLVSAAKDAQ